MKIFSYKKRSRGFLTVEVMVATSIIVVATLVALSIAEKSIKVSRRALNSAQAVFLLEEGAETARILRDNAWSNISALNPATTYYPSFSGGTWTLSTTPSQIGIFTRTVTVANVNRHPETGNISPSGSADAGTKLITVTVSWNDAGGTITRTMSFYLMDIFS